MKGFRYSADRSNPVKLRNNRFTFETDLEIKLADAAGGHNIFSIRKQNQVKNNPKVYFYCPFNQTYTKHENYNISTILDLIRKNQLENYFIIQIDNDNLLYEEILKMQFNNEFQNIHKMFDLELDYSFSPFYDSLFFNMSILTDFFYDQIEKYLIQIFFHNHGIYIINKDSCEYINEILIEKFTFNFIEGSEFFEKAIKDKKNKNKNKNILINDFKLKKIIEKNNTVDLIKSHRKYNEMNSGRNNSYRGNNSNNIYNYNSNVSKKKKNKEKNFSKTANGNFFGTFRSDKKNKNLTADSNLFFKSVGANTIQDLPKIKKDECKKRNSRQKKEVNKDENHEFDENCKDKAIENVKKDCSCSKKINDLFMMTDKKLDEKYMDNTTNLKRNSNKDEFNSNDYLLESLKNRNLDLDSFKAKKGPFNDFKSVSIIDEQLKRLNRSLDLSGTHKKLFEELENEHNNENIPESEVNKNVNNSYEEKNNFENMFMDNNIDNFSPIVDNNLLNGTTTEDNNYFKYFHPDIKNFNEKYKNDMQKITQNNTNNHIEDGFNSTRPVRGLRRKAYYIPITDPNSSELNTDNLNGVINNFNNLNSYEKWRMNQFMNLNNSNNNNENSVSRINFNTKNDKNDDENFVNNFIESGSTNFYETLYNAGKNTANSNNPNFETFFDRLKNNREINIHNKTYLKKERNENLIGNGNEDDNDKNENKNVNNFIDNGNLGNYAENFESNKNLINNHNSNKYSIRIIKVDEKSNKSEKDNKNVKENLNEKGLNDDADTNLKSNDTQPKPKKQSKIDKLFNKQLKNDEKEYSNLITVSDVKIDLPEDRNKIEENPQNNVNTLSIGCYEKMENEDNRDHKDCYQPSKLSKKSKKDSSQEEKDKEQDQNQNQEQELILADKNVEILENIEDAERVKLSANLAHIRRKPSTNLPIKTKINFSTDELIYHLLIFSLEKLEEYTESLVKEADSLKGIYLELSEKERKDFFRRIHSLEVSMHIIFKETIIKKKFFKNAKSQFKNFNKLSNDFYFKNDFSFFLELMISKVTQLELTYEKLEKFLSMIKENYHIIIEDNTEKENIKLNHVIKLLTVLTTIYAPMNIIPGLFGMNVKVPWQGDDYSTTLPFGIIVIVLAILLIVQLYIFKWLKWF